MLDLSPTAVWLRRLTRRGAAMVLPSADAPVVGWADDKSAVLWPLPVLEHAGHALVLGSSGAGKTAMVAHALVREVVLGSEKPADDRSCLFAVDPKGDLADLLLQGLAAEAPERLADVRWLDPFAPCAFAFNLCRLPLGSIPPDIRAMQLAGLVAAVSTATGAQAHLGAGARQIDVLTHVLLAALTSAHPLASPLWALDALSVEGGLAHLGIITTSQRAKQFCLTAKLGDELRVSCAARLRAAFAASDSLAKMMAAPICLDFSDLLGPGRICVVHLGRPIGGLASLQGFYSNLLCRLAIDHLLDRPSPWSGFPARVVVDEAQVVAGVLADRAEALLTTGRSKGLSLVTMTQGTVLVRDASDTLLAVLSTNCPVKFVGRLAAPDAELLARERAPSFGSDESVSTVRQRFTAAVTNLADREFFAIRPGSFRRFHTADVPLEKWAESAKSQQAELETVKQRLGQPAGSPEPVSLFTVVPRIKRTRGSRTSPASEPLPLDEKSTGQARQHRSRWG